MEQSFGNIHKTTNVLESLLNKVTDMNSLFYRNLLWLLLDGAEVLDIPSDVFKITENYSHILHL